MPIQRINFTSRRKLTREQANVLIHPAADPTAPASFDVQLDLNGLRPRGDAARVFVEAYHQTTRMRFDFGTVAAPICPIPLERRLHEFEDWKFVRFRVKVTDVTETPGRIIAWANQIKPTGPDDQNQSDLLRFKDDDLYGRLWDLVYDEEGPIVLIERTAGGAQKVGRDSHFIAAAYPEILRRALDNALLEEKAVHDDPEHWFKTWYDGFLKAKLGLPEPPAAGYDPARRVWINKAVNAFATKFQVVSHWADSQSGKD